MQDQPRRDRVGGSGRSYRSSRRSASVSAGGADRYNNTSSSSRLIFTPYNSSRPQQVGADSSNGRASSVPRGGRDPETDPPNGDHRRRASSSSRRPKSQPRTYQPPDLKDTSGRGSRSRQHRSRSGNGNQDAERDRERGDRNNSSYRRQGRRKREERHKLSPRGSDRVAAAAKNDRPPDKVYFPTRASLSLTTSHLTESGDLTSTVASPLPTGQSEASHHGLSQQGSSPVGVYHLAQPTMDSDIKAPSPIHRKKLNQWYESKHQRTPKIKEERSRDLLSESYTVGSMLDDVQETLSDDDDRTRGTRKTMESATFATLSGTTVSEDATLDQTVMSHENLFGEAENDYLKTKQSIAVCSIVVTSVQLMVLIMQLTMCGIATLDINPMVGPFPDAYSEWGGKNAYLMLTNNEWWRLVSPAFLHVGVLHLLANAFCQLDALALFEREWGSFRWVLVYLLSSVGCNATSSLFDPDSIAVGSSGSLMGLYAAKLAQVMTHTFFDLNKRNQDDAIRLDQLSSVLCGLSLVSLLSSFTYIDWSGHMGGLVTGFFAGIAFFSGPIASCCQWFLWSLVGMSGLVAFLGLVIYHLVVDVSPDEELGDACEYFRNLFPEGYDCECMWQ